MKASRKMNLGMELAVVLVLVLAGLPAGAATLPVCRAMSVMQDQQQDQPKDKKKDKKKKQNEPPPDESPDTAAGARRAVSRAMHDLQDGFEGHSPRRVTEMLDGRFEDLPRFEDAITQFLERTSEMRINFRESTNEVKGDHATVIVDAEMIFTDKARPTQDQRRRQRIQFDFVYTPKKGWKIFEITPRDFFEP